MVQRNAACPHARARAAQLSRGDRLAKPLTKNPASGDAVGWTHALWREGSSRSAPLRASTIPPLSVHIHSVAYVRVSSAGQNLDRQLEAIGHADKTYREYQSAATASARSE